MNALLSRGHLSSESIDLLLLAALPAPETNEAKEHIDGCADCRTRWRELNEDKQRFEQFVFARTLPKVEARVKAEQAGFFDRFKFYFLVPAMGLAAALALVVAGPGTQTEDDVYVGLKGAAGYLGAPTGQPSLEIFAVRGAGGAFPVAPGVTLQPNDRIRFVVKPAGARFLLVGSRDGAGVFSVYHPFGAQRSQPVSGPKVELPDAVELDGTLGTEKVVAAFSEEPITAEQLEEALKAGPQPKLPGVRFVTAEFLKVAP